jgi:hypothetical protein
MFVYELRPSQKFRKVAFVLSLLICSFTCNVSPDTPPIRISVQVQGDDDVQMFSALSREFRKLDGISANDTQPALTIHCIVFTKIQRHGGSRALKGYAASVSIIAPDGRLITHSVYTGPSVDGVAHEIAVTVNGSVIEPMRRAPQPSSSPF